MTGVQQCRTGRTSILTQSSTQEKDNDTCSYSSKREKEEMEDVVPPGSSQDATSSPCGRDSRMVKAVTSSSGGTSLLSQKLGLAWLTPTGGRLVMGCEKEEGME